MTSSMPWWLGKRRRRAESVDGVQECAGAATSIQPKPLSLPLTTDTATEGPREADPIAVSSGLQAGTPR
jgi:hypothetical protein